MLPVVDVSLTMVDVRVAAPDLVMAPEPLVLMSISPVAPVERL